MPEIRHFSNPGENKSRTLRLIRDVCYWGANLSAVAVAFCAILPMPNRPVFLVVAVLSCLIHAYREASVARRLEELDSHAPD